MDLLHIAKPGDLVTSYNETRAGFIAIALEKNRRAAPYIGLVRQPGWLSPKSCKMLRILRFLSGCCSETEVSEQLY
ncbi:MAG: type II restriction endonuclease [Spirochaetaceae bacterium]|jgi:hypothetical protein|nr:type II restriction endonuclease [Spirochaetaceae bacterium]